MLQPEFPDVTISKIRFLESQGLLDPERTPSGYRKFYDDDLRRLRWILTQQRDHFLPLKVIKERLGEADELVEVAASASAPVVVSLDAPEVAAVPAPAPAPVAPRPAPEPEVATPAAAVAPAGPTVPDRAALAEVLDRRAAEREAAAVRPGGGVLDPGPTDLGFSSGELAAAAGVTEKDIERLASFGLIEGRTVGRETIFDGDALVVARLASAFLDHGLEPRHLRMFKVAADREAGVYEQLVTPHARVRDPEARARIEHRVGELAELGQQLQAALLRRAVRGFTER